MDAAYRLLRPAVAVFCRPPLPIGSLAIRSAGAVLAVDVAALDAHLGARRDPAVVIESPDADLGPHRRRQLGRGRVQLTIVDHEHWNGSLLRPAAIADLNAAAGGMKCQKAF